MMKNLLKELKTFLSESQYEVYRGADKDLSVDDFDLEKPNEFGFHFGSEESAKHRGTSKTDSFFLKKYSITIDKPLVLDDVGRWSLESVIENMAHKNIISKEDAVRYLNDYGNIAKSNARKNYSSLVKERNLVLKQFLDNIGYDGIIYDNRGEAGGKAFIVWNNQQIKQL
jgi:hypothetical protein